MNTLETAAAERLSRARGYPYAIPETSYVIDAAGWRPLADHVWRELVAGREPVLALGSNRSPEQLARKFGAGDRSPIPVVLARLTDFDVVYSAHIARYGAVPVTLHHAPGTEVTVSVTWLDPTQVVRMHETEAVGVNYDYGCLDDIRAVLAGGHVLTKVFAYVSRRGCLRHGGTPLAMAEAPAQGRRWPACSQVDVQTMIRDRLAPGEDLDVFTLAQADAEETRRERTARLAADAFPFAYAGYEAVSRPST